MEFSRTEGVHSCDSHLWHQHSASGGGAVPNHGRKHKVKCTGHLRRDCSWHRVFAMSVDVEICTHFKQGWEAAFQLSVQ
jgi:hypothetical protein